MHILGIDRWTKRIGLATMDAKHPIPLPLGYVTNTPDLYPNLASLVIEKSITTIVVGYPERNKALTVSIDKFITNLGYSIDPRIQIIRIDEHFSSVQASELTHITSWSYRKDISQDTVSAMVLLERRKEWQVQS